MSEIEIIKILEDKKFVGEKWVIKHYPLFHSKIIQWGIDNSLDIEYKEYLPPSIPLQDLDIFTSIPSQDLIINGEHLTRYIYYN